MATQTVVWTALPNGVRDGRLHLSVFSSPRLVGDSPQTTLAAFGDWKNWPAVKITFFVKVGGAAEVKATAVGPALRSDLWTKLFTDTTRVVGSSNQMASLSERVVRTPPTTKVREFVRNEYGKVGAWWSTEPPAAFSYFEWGGGDLRTQGLIPFPIGPKVRLGDVRLNPDAKQRAIGVIRNLLESKRRVTGDEPELAGFPREAIHFLLVDQFHRRDSNENPRICRVAIAAAVTGPPELDFHTAVGALGEYPALLRMFGLVRDISIPMVAATPAVPVSVRAEWTPLISTTNVSPATECAITSSTFLAVASPGSLIKNGLLELEKPNFELMDIDPDAGARAINASAETIERARNEDILGPQPPPALESTGLSLTHADRASTFDTLLAKAAGLEQGLRVRNFADTTINAEDIMRGFRLDVWDDVSKAWHSLCLRKGTYTFNGIMIQADDEGTIVTGHTEQPGDTTIYLHESLARWAGYSLVAPRPGLGTSDSGELVGGDTAPDPAFNLKAAFRAAPGSLPRLRYGRTYRMRARIVDLAGNGLRLSDVPASATQVSEAVKYRRYEPVAPPFALLRKPRSEGESPERMVIRSNYNTAATGDSQRHLAPQQIAELTAEQHGMFDIPKGLLTPPAVSKAAYSTIVSRNEGSFADTGTPDPRGQEQKYYDTDQLTLPYLPDVLARGAAFQGLPGSSDTPVMVDFDFGLLAKWPAARPFRIRIVEGSGAPAFDSHHRVLTVKIPKGRMFDVRYSSRINAADRDLLGLWAWLVDYVESGGEIPSDFTIAELEQAAVQGKLWQLTPFRTLTLVHAIRQPLTVPAFSKPIAVRKIGETSAAIVDKVSVDGPSTIKLDVVANWREQIDVIAKPGPEPLDGQARAFTTEVGYNYELIQMNQRHEFGDLKYRRVNYSLIGTTRYAEYFVERKKVQLIKDTAVAVSAAGIVFGSDSVAAMGESPATFVRDLDYRVDTASGKITALVDSLNNQTVEVSFVAPPITRSSTEAKPAAIVDIPSAGRPIAPEIAYIVPTFGWEKSATTSKRLGNGVRVFLKRPWYSSGDGEQLGVLLMNGNTQPLAKMERYVTMWGEDPAFASAATSGVPLVGNFPVAIRSKLRIKLAESDRDTSLTDTVAVAPHDVFYDAERQLWYSDITLTPPGQSYGPFVRFALARYQPISITGVELSTSVLAQFVQLSPDRTLTIVSDASDPTKVQLAVAGLTYRPVSGYASHATIDVLVQTQNPALSGDLAWSTASTTTLPDNWSGTVTLPAARGSQPFRLVIQEFEKPSKGGRRLVYTDAVQI